MDLIVTKMSRLCFCTLSQTSFSITSQLPTHSVFSEKHIRFFVIHRKLDKSRWQTVDRPYSSAVQWFRSNRVCKMVMLLRCIFNVFCDLDLWNRDLETCPTVRHICVNVGSTHFSGYGAIACTRLLRSSLGDLDLWTAVTFFSATSVMRTLLLSSLPPPNGSATVTRSFTIWVKCLPDT